MHEIVLERFEKQKELTRITEKFKMEQKKLNSEIAELERLELIGKNNIDVEKIQIAEDVLEIYGDIYGCVDGNYRDWVWKSRNVTTGNEIDYLVNPKYTHYSPNLYDYEAYDVKRYI